MIEGLAWERTAKMSTAHCRAFTISTLRLDRNILGRLGFVAGRSDVVGIDDSRGFVGLDGGGIFLCPFADAGSNRLLGG